MEKVKDLLKSPYLWVILFIVLLGFIAFAVVFQNDESGYLLISNIDSYSCTKEKCNKVTSEVIMNEQNQSNYLVYQKDNYLGEYKVEFVNKWNFFDINGNWINLQSDFLAGSINTNLVVKEYEKRAMSSEETMEINKILQKNKITKYSILSQNEVILYDLNQDGLEEKVIFASNVTDESNDEKLFSMVVGVIQDRYEVLFIDVFNQHENYEVPTYRFKNVINLFNQKNDLMLFTKSYFSEVGEPMSFIYKIDKKKFKLINE